MEARFEEYVKFSSKKPCPDDDDITVYTNVTVLKDMTPDKGPKAGEKYLRVDLYTLNGSVVFRLKSGGCRVVSMAANKPPVFGGEFAQGSEVQADDC